MDGLSPNTEMYPTPANMAKADPTGNLDPWSKAANMARTMQSLKMLGAGSPYGQTPMSPNTGAQ